MITQRWIIRRLLVISFILVLAFLFAHTTTIEAATCPVITTRLSSGVSHSQVIALKKFLVSEGVMAPTANTTFFGPLTQAALQKWQCKKGIVCKGTPASTGYGATGPMTRAALKNCTAAAATVMSQADMVPGGTDTNGGKLYTYASCSFNNQIIPHSLSITAYQSATVGYGQQCVSERRVCTKGILSGSYAYASCSAALATSCSFNGQTIAHGASVTAYEKATVPYGQVCKTETRTCANGALSGVYTQNSCSIETAKNLDLQKIKIRVGRPLIVRGPFADELDGYFHEIKLPNGQFRGFSAKGPTYAIDGPNSWSMGGPRVKVKDLGPVGSTSECGSWLTSTFTSNNLLYGLFHDEKSCNYGINQSHKSMSIGQSADGGLTWTSLGQIITGEDAPTVGKVTGEADCTSVQPGDGYVYAYCLRSSDFQTIVARVPLTDPAPGKWKKWDGTGWNAPGIGGHAEKIGYTGPGAGYWPLGNATLLVTADKWFKGMRLDISQDSIHYSTFPEPLFPLDDASWVRPSPSELVTYSYVFDSMNASPQLGNSFYLSYIYLPPGGDFDKRYLVLQDVSMSVESTPVSVPQIGLALTQWVNATTQSPWTSSGVVDVGYSPQALLGYVLTKADTSKQMVKLEECIAGNDHLITNDGTCTTVPGYTRLRTAGWIYQTEQENTKPLYRCYSPSKVSHFASTNTGCDGLGNMEWLLGYILKS